MYRKNHLGRQMKTDKVFVKISIPTERDYACHLRFRATHHAVRLETGKMENVREFPTLLSEQEESTTSKGSPEFPTEVP